jgi:chemotaxis protein methyltransferase CheR
MGRNIYEETLTGKQFKQLSAFIHEHMGIKMPPTKKIMLEGRLRRRLKTLGISSFHQYLQYLFSSRGMEEELIHMIDAITTNKTDFFREPKHFDFLVTHAIPQLITTYGAGIKRKLTVWSAGCSTGEEAYTLAMILSQFGEKYPGLEFDFHILATDISTKVLEIATRAVYSEQKAADIPLPLKKNYLMKSKDSHRQLVRIVPRLRARVKFRRLNFLQEDFGFREQMDIIFFRNVIIYFDKSTQEEILRKVVNILRPEGYLFMGHSETILELNLPLKQAAATVYKRAADW